MVEGFIPRVRKGLANRWNAATTEIKTSFADTRNVLGQKFAASDANEYAQHEAHRKYDTVYANHAETTEERSTIFADAREKRDAAVEQAPKTREGALAGINEAAKRLQEQRGGNLMHRLAYALRTGKAISQERANRNAIPQTTTK